MKLFELSGFVKKLKHVTLNLEEKEDSLMCGYSQGGQVRSKKTRQTGRQARKEETQNVCGECKGKGRVYVHDPDADGHGGANGGAWVWLGCSGCNGTGNPANKQEKRF